MRRLILALSAVALLATQAAFAITPPQSRVVHSEGGTHTGFLPQSTGQFSVANFLTSSNDFVPADGFWSSAGNIAVAPTVTTVSDTLPDGTTGNVSKAAFPAISAGTTGLSLLFFREPVYPSYYPSSFGVWAKVVSGTGTLFTSISPTNVATYADAPIPNDGNWHFVQANWVGQSQQGAGTLTTLEIGIAQTDPNQQASVGATTIELTGAYLVGPQSANVPSYADVKVGGSVAATGTNPKVGTVIKPMPAKVALRDFSEWSLYAGNPIMQGNPNEVWAGGGMGNPVIQPQFRSGGFYYAWNGQCFPSPAVNNLQYTAQCLYKSTDGLNWTEVLTNAPYLFLTGSNMFNPVISNAGAGFTASASGTATWTGGGCATPPVIAITTNGSGAIATATPSPNNGLGTGSCPIHALPTGTSWSFSGVGTPTTLPTFNWTQTEGTQAPPGPARWELHPNFLPYGCSDGTNPHNFCVVYSAEDSSTVGHLFMAWSDTVDGVYTPMGCTAGTCGTTVPATLHNYPSAGYNSPGTPFVINVGGPTGTNYIYAYVGSGGDAGVNYEILTTPANKADTTSGNTLTFVQDAGFTLTTGVDWYAPVAGTKFIDMGVYLNHCGFYEWYFVVESSTSPSPPWPAGSGAFAQIMGEAVSDSPLGPWYQLQQPVINTNSGDPAAIELGGHFILSSTYNAPISGTGAGFALLGPQGSCPGSMPSLVNASIPSISGTPQVGSTLTASNGSWTGNPTAFAYQWLSGGSPISGATSTTYVPVTGDAGANLSVKVTASNPIRSTPATSATVGPVAAPAAPVNTVLPAISGTPQVGSTLTASNGTWSNSPTGFADQWLSGGSPISGATSTTYVPVTGNIGATLSVTVTATNGVGSTPATSSGVGPVTAASGCGPATTYLARTSGGNEGGNATNITNLICGLVADGVITGNLSTTGCGTTLDALYVLAQQNSSDALLNVCGTNYTATLVGSPTFTALTGFSGFGVTSPPKIITNFNSTTATSPNYTQNSASFGFWSVAVVTEPESQMATNDVGATGESNMFDSFTGNQFHARVNNGADTGVATPGTKGLFVAERPSSTSVIPYWDGVAQATQTATSQAPANLPFLIGVGGAGAAQGTAQTIAEAHIGGSLGATLNLALFNRLRTYMTAVGVP